MSWVAQIENSNPPLHFELTSPEGLHAYTINASEALKLSRKLDAAKLNDLTQETVIPVDLGGVDSETWVLVKSGTTDAYLNLSLGFFETTNNPSAALQFPSQSEANKLVSLLEEAYVPTLLE